MKPVSPLPLIIVYSYTLRFIRPSIYCRFLIRFRCLGVAFRANSPQCASTTVPVSSTRLHASIGCVARPEFAAGSRTVEPRYQWQSSHDSLTAPAVSGPEINSVHAPTPHDELEHLPSGALLARRSGGRMERCVYGVSVVSVRWSCVFNRTRSL